METAVNALNVARPPCPRQRIITHIHCNKIARRIVTHVGGLYQYFRHASRFTFSRLTHHTKPGVPP